MKCNYKLILLILILLIICIIYFNKEDFTTSSGNPTVTSGNPTVTSGNPTVTSGNPTVTSGNPTVTCKLIEKQEIPNHNVNSNNEIANSDYYYIGNDTYGLINSNSSNLNIIN